MRRGLALAGIALALVASATCRAPVGTGFNPVIPLDLPQPDAVDAVVFLIGDAGEASLETSPTLRRLRSDVEFWSGNLATDSAVTVLFLGDNVYPSGVHDRGHPSFPQDSSRLWSQIRVLEGSFARERGASGIFLPGNHDWGNMPGERGLSRLWNQADMLDSARTRGFPVWMMPSPGDPGPALKDLRRNVRLLLMDTHWFLQESEVRSRDDFFAEVYRAMEGAEDRHVIMAAHHPYQSAGPHGLLAPGARALGLLYLLRRTGTLVQDLNSPIYSAFLDRMHQTFRAVGHPPLIFAAGHDHSLQVIDPRTPEGPRTVLVSGAGSKLTDVARAPFLRFAATKPGYMTLVFRTNEAVDLYVFAGDVTEGLRVVGEEETNPACESAPEGEREFCAEREAAAMNLVYSERLAPAASLPDTSTIRVDTPRVVPDTSATRHDTTATRADTTAARSDGSGRGDVQREHAHQLRRSDPGPPRGGIGPHGQPVQAPLFPVVVRPEAVGVSPADGDPRALGQLRPRAPEGHDPPAREGLRAGRSRHEHACEPRDRQREGTQHHGQRREIRDQPKGG